MREHQTDYTRPLDIRHGCVDMTHGAGGRATKQLIDEIFAPAFDNEFLRQGHDGATMPAPAGELVMSCDGHVVHPLFFKGGDIGRLSVCGTVNDVAVCGARPLYLSASFILEEGLPLSQLERVVQSMAATARLAGVSIVTGDTKVVEKGLADGLYIATTGVGVRYPGMRISGAGARPGDAVLVTGTMGDHGMSILCEREGIALGNDLQSDVAPLNSITDALIGQLGDAVHVLRDPTRGGLGTTLNEIATQSGVGIELDETQIPVTPTVQSACEFLGLDPLYIANEGKLIVIVRGDAAAEALRIIRADALGQQAQCIGSVTADNAPFVSLKTAIGGHRTVDWLNSDPLPRIC